MKLRKTLTAVLASLAFASAASQADAAWISTGYCAASLRGETGQAPDNDIRQAWDLIQAQGYNVVSSYDNPAGWSQWPNLTQNVYWRFYVSGGGAVYANFRCYWGSDGVYHDGRF